MSDILCDNFESELPKIIDAINKSRFIAIDTEFTALYIKSTDKPSLFDTPQQRYAKLRRTVQHAIPIQVGISAFHFNPSSNVYQAHTFTFYVWPRPIMSINHLLQMQATSFEFLSRYDFDFNKLFYKGIQYLNKEQESQVLNDFKSNNLNTNLDNSLEAYIDDILPQITKWFSKAQENDTYTVESSEKMFANNIHAQFLIQYELRYNVPDFKQILWTDVTDNQQLVLTKISVQQYKELNKDFNQNLKNKTLNAALGFTKVYRALIAARKPIVGHNMLMDMLLFENSFNKNLPKSYKQFKRDLHENFVKLIDTKCLSIFVIKQIARRFEWKKNTLQDLYAYFRSGHGRILSFSTPFIKTNLDLEKTACHHAGWDSYCTGFIFIHMAHYLASNNLGIKTHKARIITSTEHFNACQSVENQINLIRGSVSHLNIAGPDPKSTRPPWLVAISLNKELDLKKVVQALSKYGFIEIENITPHRAVLAVASRGDAKEILKIFITKYRKDFIVTKYNVLYHGKYADNFKIGAIALGIGAIIGVVYKICYY